MTEIFAETAFGGFFASENQPAFFFQFSPTTNPLDDPVWVDITTRVLHFDCSRGRQFELNRMEAGTATVVLDNHDRLFDPMHDGSVYYPNLLPLKKFQAYATFGGQRYDIFTGYVEAWPVAWEGTRWSVANVTIVDAHELLSIAQIVSDAAAVTTAQGSNKDLTWTAAVPGVEGNSISVVYDLLASAEGGPTDTVATQGALSGTGTGTFTVSDGSMFPTASTTYAIDSEQITCTRSGATMTITARAVNGTIAAAHAGGAVVREVMASATINSPGALAGTATGAATFTITSGSFPGGSTLYQIDNEIVSATTSGGTMTITARAQNGTHAAPHAAGAVIVEYSANAHQAYVSTDGATYVGVHLGTDNSGGATVTTATAVAALAAADPDVAALVAAALAPGSSGAGKPATATYALAGGTFAQELSGARIGHVLDHIGWPAGDRDLDAGQSLVAARSFHDQDQQQALNHVQDVEASENGFTFANESGAITYHDRAHRVTALRSVQNQFTFGDEDGDGSLEYLQLQPSFDKLYIYNRAIVTAYGGAAPQQSDDAASQGQYGVRLYQVSNSQLTSDADALAFAQYIVGQYSQPQLRWASMTIEPLGNAALWVAALSARIGDRVTVQRNPSETGLPIAVQNFVDKISWTLDPPADAKVSFMLTPVLGPQVMKLDDATLGKLDDLNKLTF